MKRSKLAKKLRFQTIIAFSISFILVQGFSIYNKDWNHIFLFVTSIIFIVVCFFLIIFIGDLELSKRFKDQKK